MLLKSLETAVKHTSPAWHRELEMDLKPLELDDVENYLFFLSSFLAEGNGWKCAQSSRGTACKEASEGNIFR